MSTDAIASRGDVATAGTRSGATRKHVAVYAPHLVTPIRNGGDLYIWRKWGALDPTRFSCLLYGADAVYQLGDGGWQACRVAAGITLRSRPAAAAVAMLTGRDYHSAKFNTRAYLDLMRGSAPPRADVSVFSYVSTYLFVAPSIPNPGRELVETHNYDTKYFLDLGLEAQGGTRAAAWMAAGRAHRLLGTLARSVPLVAVGEADACIFRALGHERVIVAGLGYDERPARAVFASAEPLRIAFVGSLSVRMNTAALRRFIADALPSLRRALGCPVELVTAGSHPSPALAAEIRRHGGTVHANLEDEALAAVLQHCHATILPFDASNGLKLKFALAASLGVPMLSYISPPPELAGASAVLVSRDMDQWAAFLERLRAPAAQAQASRELQGIVRGRSWAQVANATLQALDLHRTAGVA